MATSSASGDLLSNVNRWRGQIQVPPVDQNTLENVLTKMKVDGRDASYVELLGPATPAGQQSIYGVVVTDTPQTSWFVKMTGDAAVNLVREAIEMSADQFAFLFDTLGVPAPAAR